MKPLALALLAILVVVALRRREPDRAVMRMRAPRRPYPQSREIGRPLRSREPGGPVWREDDDGVLPGDPYPDMRRRGEA